MKDRFVQLSAGSVETLQLAGNGPRGQYRKEHVIAHDCRGWRSYTCAGKNCLGCGDTVTRQRFIAACARWSNKEKAWSPALWVPTMSINGIESVPFSVVRRQSGSTGMVFDTVIDPPVNLPDPPTKLFQFASKWLEEALRPATPAEIRFMRVDATPLSYQCLAGMLGTVEKTEGGWVGRYSSAIDPPAGSSTFTGTWREVQHDVESTLRARGHVVVRHIETSDGWAVLTT